MDNIVVFFNCPQQYFAQYTFKRKPPKFAMNLEAAKLSRNMKDC